MRHDIVMDLLVDIAKAATVSVRRSVAQEVQKSRRKHVSEPSQGLSRVEDIYRQWYCGKIPRRQYPGCDVASGLIEKLVQVVVSRAFTSDVSRLADLGNHRHGHPEQAEGVHSGKSYNRKHDVCSGTV